MRVVNDREEKTEPSELGFFSIASYALLAAVGIATVIFGPLPMIVGHMRLSDPWPKVAAVLGAIIALTFLEVPVPLVVMTFIFGLFVADGVWKEVDFWKLVRDAALLALGMGLVGAIVAAQVQRVDLIQFWTKLVDSWMSELQTAMHVEKSVQWEVMRGVFLYEGPFLYVSAVILSLWLSIGVAAHLGILSDGHRFSGAGLRKIRLPAWVSLFFMLLFIGAFFGAEQVQHFCGGVFRLGGSIMFIQGCICLSELLARRAVRPRARTLVYSVAVLLGFYALMGMGAMSPWIFKNRETRSEEVL